MCVGVCVCVCAHICMHAYTCILVSQFLDPFVTGRVGCFLALSVVANAVVSMGVQVSL